MSKCPACHEDIEILGRVYINMDSFNKTFATTKTECCGAIVTVERSISYNYRPSTATEDDWGRE